MVGLTKKEVEVLIEAAGSRGVLVTAGESVDLGPAIAAGVLVRRIDA